MIGELACRNVPTLHRSAAQPMRAAFVGPPVLLSACMPEATSMLTCGGFEARAGQLDAMVASLGSFAAEAIVVIDPPALPTSTLLALAALPALTLGVLIEGMPEGEAAHATAALDRVVSFEPSLTGEPLGESRLWRAMPPPVADRLFSSGRPLHRAPRAMSIGRSTRHRELMLLPTKHHHDLLEVLHGVAAAELQEMLVECDIGVFVSREKGGAFGQQAAMHLAAGHLLLCEELRPAHGLERDIDYLSVDSPRTLEEALWRLRRFPEMHERIRVRGRMKAEQFRASRVFERLLHDLALDVAAFAEPSSAAGATSSPTRA